MLARSQSAGLALGNHHDAGHRLSHLAQPGQPSRQGGAGPSPPGHLLTQDSAKIQLRFRRGKGNCLLNMLK